jgi:hypothetical protein
MPLIADLMLLPRIAFLPSSVVPSIPNLFIIHARQNAIVFRDSRSGQPALLYDPCLCLCLGFAGQIM